MMGYSHVLKNFPEFVVIYTVKGFSVVNETEVDVFLEFSSFFYDPVDVGNLISGSSAFSKSSSYIWKFSVHILLKPRKKAAKAAKTQIAKNKRINKNAVKFLKMSSV